MCRISQWDMYAFFSVVVRPGVEIPAGLPDREVYLFYEEQEHVSVTRQLLTRSLAIIVRVNANLPANYTQVRKLSP